MIKRFIWNTYLESLDKKYTLFCINRSYKDKSFKDESEYLKVQTKLAEEIDILNKEIKEEITKVVHETYPEVEVILYDSRMFSKADQNIGKILTKNIKSQTETLDVKACFEKFVPVKITVERYEDLNEETQKEIDKILNGTE